MSWVLTAFKPWPMAKDGMERTAATHTSVIESLGCHFEPNKPNQKNPCCAFALEAGEPACNVWS